jgi:hypothetical protein
MICKMKIRVGCIIIIILIMFGYSCTNKNEETLYPNSGSCDTTNVTFSQTLQPIFNTNCIVCHSGVNAPLNVHLDSYAGVKIVADKGLLKGVLNGSPFQMPPSGRLDDCLILKIENWVNKGSLNN